MPARAGSAYPNDACQASRGVPTGVTDWGGRKGGHRGKCTEGYQRRASSGSGASTAAQARPPSGPCRRHWSGAWRPRRKRCSRSHRTLQGHEILSCRRSGFLSFVREGFILCKPHATAARLQSKYVCGLAGRPRGGVGGRSSLMAWGRGLCGAGFGIPSMRRPRCKGRALQAPPKLPLPTLTPHTHLHTPSSPLSSLSSPLLPPPPPKKHAHTHTQRRRHQHKPHTCIHMSPEVGCGVGGSSTPSSAERLGEREERGVAGGSGWMSLGTMTRSRPSTSTAPALLAVPQ